MLKKIAVALALSAGAAQAASPDLTGLYTKGGIGCDPALAGKSGGPVLIDSQTLKLAGITCRLGSRTNVSRMNAALVDMTCNIGNVDKSDRFFVQQNWEGITLVSEKFGTFVLQKCGDVPES
jgi:hypothetical protein